MMSAGIPRTSVNVNGRMHSVVAGGRETGPTWFKRESVRGAVRSRLFARGHVCMCIVYAGDMSIRPER